MISLLVALFFATQARAMDVTQPPAVVGVTAQSVAPSTANVSACIRNPANGTVFQAGCGAQRVGVGTASPVTLLDVEGAAQFGSGVSKTSVTATGQILIHVQAVQTIAAGNTITADACGGIKQIDAAGAVTTDTTNTFTAPAASNRGCCMDVIHIGAANNITLDANANFNAAADVVMTPCDSLRVCSNGTDWFPDASLVANTCN